MKIIDTHCDALLKLQEVKRKDPYGEHSLDYKQDEQLDTNVNRLTAGGVMAQFYAIFIYPEIPDDEKWQHALEQVDLFYTEVLGKNKQIKHIKQWSDFDALKDGEIGAVLTLEGADAFGNDLMKLRHLYRLGVLSLGLTWNNANLCADGVGEERGAGLSLLGKDVVRLNNEQKVLTDVSHLAVEGFWDVLKLADYPFASHSNARALCDHERNLYDEQIKQLIHQDGQIHLVFNPPFINDGRDDASIADVIKHIDHICSLGGVHHLGFGSDFDGIERKVTNLADASNYHHLINELLKHFKEEEVKGFAYQNFLNNRPR